MLENISVNQIELGLAAEDWAGALRLAARPLLDAAAVTEGYIEAIVRSVEANGPYFIIDKGLLLAHARPEEGALRNAIHFSVFDPGVDFGVPAMDPIRLIVSFSATDADRHIELMEELALCLADRGRLEALMEAESPEAFLALLREA